MKLNRRIKIVLAFTALAALTLSPLPAANTFTWTNTAGGTLSWTTAANWLGGSNSPVAADTVSFVPVTVADTTLTLDGNRTAAAWKFVGSAFQWVVNPGSSSLNKITIPSSGATITVNSNTTTLNCNLDGTAGLTKAGLGTLILAGTNTYSGGNGTYINAGGGTIIFQGTNAAPAGGTTTLYQISSGASALKLLADGVGTNTFPTTVAFDQRNSSTGIGFTVGNTGSGNGGNGGGTTTGATIAVNSFSFIENQGAVGGVDGPANIGINNGYTLQIGTVQFAANANLSANWPCQLVPVGGSITVTGTVQQANGNTSTGKNVLFKLDGTSLGNVITGNILDAADYTSGANSNASPLAITKTSTSTWALAGNNNYSGGTTLSGGILEADNNGALGAGLVTMSGGTLSNNVSATLANAIKLSAAATVGVGSGQTFTLGGVISGTFALAKTGAGTLTLAGVNTNSGTTTVKGGALIGVTGGGCANSAVTVSNLAGCTLGVQVNDNTKQWTCASLTNAGVNATLAFGFAITPSLTVAPLNVTGNLVFTGIPGIALDAANLTAGTYPLIVVGGTAPTGVPTVTINGAKGTLAAIASWGGTGNKTLSVNVTGSSYEPLTWNMSGSGTWDINTTAAWQDNNGNTAIKYLEAVAGDQVQFTDAGLSADTVVTLNTYVKPVSVTVSNLNYNYTISGAGGISGAIGLAKSGSRTLTLATINNYTGGTKVTGGTLQAGVASVVNGFSAFGNNSAVTLANTAGVVLDLNGFNMPIGSLTGGGIAGGNVTLGAGTLTVGGDNTSPAAYAGSISGTGGLTKIGIGTLTLAGTNIFKGKTVVSNGTLRLTSSAGLSSFTDVYLFTSTGALDLAFTGTNRVDALYINGILQPDGVYSATTPPITGTGYLLVAKPDSVGDGIPDWWRAQYFGGNGQTTNALSSASADPDGDGLINLLEYQNGTNPTNADTDGDGLSDGAEVLIYHTNPLKSDTDGDGISDWDEINIYHTNPLLADTDGDGVGDWYELFATFTSPTNAADKSSIPYPLPRPTSTTPATNKPVKVFILSGQSNMVGEADVNPIGTAGTLSTIVKQQNKFPDLLDTNGNWSVWSNVMYRGVVTAIGNSPLTPGYGASSVQFGPELGFGHVMGYYMNEPVLLIKSSQGNRGLFWDILPPGSPRYTNGTTVYAGYGEGPNSWSTTTNGGPSPFVWYAGKQYDDFFLATSDMGAPAWANGTAYTAGCYVKDSGAVYTAKSAHTSSAATEPGVGASWTTYWNVYTIENVTTVLDNFATQYPQWAAQGFQISGYVWFQGNWDIVNGSISANRYETNLVNFIKQLRAYYANRYPGKCSTNTPFVLATGCGDPGTNGNGLIVANAQLVMTNTARYPEFAGNVKTMDTRPYWRDASVSPNAGQSYHYFHNAETYMLTGDALARGMISMLSTGTVATNDYSSWATNFPGVDLSDPNADFDGDGMSNEQERIWGLNPTNATSRQIFTFNSSLSAGNFSYTRRDPALTGLSYTVWTSTNLVNWTQDTGAVQTPGATVNQVQSVSVTLSSGLVNGPRLFIRLLAQ